MRFPFVWAVVVVVVVVVVVYSTWVGRAATCGETCGVRVLTFSEWAR